jgi:tetratricopeptide (TPR) repeat protein
MTATVQRMIYYFLFLLILLVPCIFLTAASGDSLGPDNLSPGMTASQWNDRGNTYSNQLRWDLAIDAYSRAIEIDSSFARAYFNRGKAYAEMGRYDEAIADYEMAIVHDPSLRGVIEHFLDTAVRNRYVTLPGEALLKGTMLPGGQFLAVDNTKGNSDVVIALTPQGQRGAILAVYVAKGHSYRFDQVVPPGIYDVYITAGERWNPKEKAFAVETGYLMWRAPQVFAGSGNGGLTLTFIQWHPPSSWLDPALVPITPEKFPVL